MAEKITIRVSFDQTAISMGVIGRVGENISRQILFDCTSAMSGRTSASIICVAKRPGDSEPYPVSLTRVGSTNVYRLVLSSTEVAVAGTVQFELRMLDGSEILKAAICTGTVENSLTGIADAPGAPIPDALNRFDAALKKLESTNVDVDAAVNAAYEATEAANAVAAYPVGVLSGGYSVSVGESAVTIDTSSGVARVLCNGLYTTPTAAVHTLSKQGTYNHYVIVYKDNTFALQPASVYSAAADTDAACIGVVYFDDNGKVVTYEINGQVKDKVADEETQIAMSMAANQFGMLGGNYALTVGAEEITIDARNGLMRVLGGNTWWTVPARKWVLSKPEGLNHGIIYFSWDAFRVVGASAFLGDKNEEQFPVGIVYWDANGKITKYEINGQVSDQRTPAYGGDVVRDVRLFGATGDGVTDDTDAIQAALDACTNGILYFPNGTYLFRKTLYIHSNTHIMGNKGYTRIKLKPQQANELDELEWRPADNRSKYPAVRTDENSTGVIVEGIIFEGDTTYFHDLQQNGLYITGSHHVIQDCQFIKWNYFPDEWAGRQENASAWGLAICHANHIKVEDCHFNQNGYEGAGTEFSYQVDFRGCYFGKAMRTALQIHRSSVRISLEGCVLNNSVDDDNPLGDFATMTFHGANGALIDGVKIVNCDFRHRHIQCVDGYERNVQISNCRIYSDSNRFVAITMGGSANPPQDEGWQIVGNEFFSTKEDGQTTIHANVNASMVACNIIHTNANTPVVLNGTSNLAVNNLVVPVSVA